MTARNRTVTPMLPPEPVTIEEVRGWYQASMHRDPNLIDEHLADFVSLLNDHLQFNFHVGRAVKASGASLPSPGKVIDDLYAVRKALNKLSVLGDEFWTYLGMPAVPDIRLALERLGPQRKRKSGRKRQAWNAYAERYAHDIADTLRAAGVRNPSEDHVGPVARIGALAIKRVFNRKPPLPTFVSAVRAERRRRGG